MRLLTGSSIAIICHTLISTAHALPYVTDSGLSIDTLYKVECSRKTQQGDTVHVHYNGTLTDGTTFDSSYNRNSPIAFKLGMGQVIRGWDEGLMDMCIGEERLLTIPPELGYGSRGVGPIPANSVLVFGTKLVSIDGVPKDQDPLLPPPTPSVTAAPTTAVSSILSTTLATSTTPTTSTNIPASSTTSTTSPPTAIPTDGSKPGAEAGECRLLGPFALFVQGGLGILALLSLVLKRYRESPRRPVKVWAFDASKQILGSILLHILNLVMSMLGTGDIELNTPDIIDLSTQLAAQGDGSAPNPCSFYLINLAIDTTIGIPILVILLGLLGHGAALTPLANPPESLRSGNYGHPPRFTWWLKQALIYFIGLLLMKLCVYFIFQLLPWIAWVGDWCLRWTEGSETLQIVFVMFIFPVCMNALQYYIIDSYIKDPAGGTHMPVATSDRSSDDPRDEDDDDDETAYASEQEVDSGRSNVKGDAGVKAKEIGSQLEGADEREAAVGTTRTSSSSSSRGGK